jgi:hypothetical protein
MYSIYIMHMENEKCIQNFDQKTSRENHYVTYEILAAVNIRITALWDATPCGLLDRYQHSGAICCLHRHSSYTRQMEAAGSSETSVLIVRYETTRCHIPWDHDHFRTRQRIIFIFTAVITSYCTIYFPRSIFNFILLSISQSIKWSIFVRFSK